MIEATTVDALSTIALLMAIMLMYPTKRLIHVFLDNARYHHAVIVQAWLARPGARSDRALVGLMHRHVTHNRSHATYNDFCRSVLHFLRQEVPKNWAVFCDSVTDNFRVINPADFRVLRVCRSIPMECREPERAVDKLRRFMTRILRRGCPRQATSAGITSQ